MSSNGTLRVPLSIVVKNSGLIVDLPRWSDGSLVLVCESNECEVQALLSVVLGGTGSLVRRYSPHNVTCERREGLRVWCPVAGDCQWSSVVVIGEQ